MRTILQSKFRIPRYFLHDSPLIPYTPTRPFRRSPYPRSSQCPIPALCSPDIAKQSHRLELWGENEPFRLPQLFFQINRKELKSFTVVIDSATSDESSMAPYIALTNSLGLRLSRSRIIWRRSNSGSRRRHTLFLQEPQSSSSLILTIPNFLDCGKIIPRTVDLDDSNHSTGTILRTLAALKGWSNVRPTDSFVDSYIVFTSVC